MDMIDLFFRTDSQIVEMYDREISSRTKPETFSAIFLPHTNDCAWLATVATLNSVCACVRLLFEGDYYFVRRAHTRLLFEGGY